MIRNQKHNTLQSILFILSFLLYNSQDLSIMNQNNVNKPASSPLSNVNAAQQQNNNVQVPIISNANFAQQQNVNFIQQQPLFMNSNPSVQQQSIFSSPNVQQPYMFNNSNPFAQQQSSNMNFIPPQQIQTQVSQSNNFIIEQIPEYQTNNASLFYQQNNYAPQQLFGMQMYGGNHTAQFRLLNDKAQDKEKEVVAVIITLNTSGSYDHLFSSVQQKSLEGTRVLVYAGDSFYIQKLIKAFQGQPQDDVTKQMMKHIKSLHSDCVVFNWQCCGGYGSQIFPEGKDKLFKFLKLIIDKGHMAMFSDFSLKALISQWDEHLMGPNPFVKITETSTPFQIRFKAGDLKECPSAQLQIVGQMAIQGRCNISVMGGTIVYSVDNTKLNHDIYKLKVLTVNTTQKIQNKNHLCKIGQFQGAAGHILLTYKSGGHILTSMGHWIQLMKIDTSEHKLFQVAEKQYGKQYAENLKMQYANIDVNQQKAWVSSNAVNFVQNQAPCSNMSQKVYKKG